MNILPNIFGEFFACLVYSAQELDPGQHMKMLNVKGKVVYHDDYIFKTSLF